MPISPFPGSGAGLIVLKCKMIVFGTHVVYVLPYFVSTHCTVVNSEYTPGANDASEAEVEGGCVVVGSVEVSGAEVAGAAFRMGVDAAGDSKSAEVVGSTAPAFGFPTSASMTDFMTAS
jgi:hypothetical protein